MIKISKFRTQITFHKVVREPVTNQYNLVLAKRRWYSQAGKITADLASYGRFITNSNTCSLLRDHDQLCHQRLHGDYRPLYIYLFGQTSSLAELCFRSLRPPFWHSFCLSAGKSRSQHRMSTKHSRHAQTVALRKWLIFGSDSYQHVDPGSLFHFLHHCTTEDFKRFLIISHTVTGRFYETWRNDWSVRYPDPD